MPNQICPIVGRQTTNSETEYSVGEWKIVRCEETGFVFLANPPSYERLEEEFAWEKTEKAERERRVESEPVFQAVSSTMKQAKSVLHRKRNKMFDLLQAMVTEDHGREISIVDIGCGAGGLLVDISSRFAQRGIKVNPTGIEVSTELARISHENLTPYGGQVVQLAAVDGANQLPENSVDFIVLQSFLEHESQPLILLRRLAKVLRPNGAIVLKVPNFNCWNRRIRGSRWCGFRYPDHVNYFTPETLATLAEQAGFVVARQSLMERLPLSDNMYAVLQLKSA